MRSIAERWCGQPIEVTEPGEWGPWVDGGAWLIVDDIHVDWLYRDPIASTQSGKTAAPDRVKAHHQVGHPFGFVDAAYAGEVALGQILVDPDRQLTLLQKAAAVYPPALRDAIAAWLWEADFDIDIATKPVDRTDTTYIAGCLFRAVVVCAHVLCADAGSWVVNEKGVVAVAASMPNAPRDFGARAHGLLGSLGTTADSLQRAVADARGS